MTDVERAALGKKATEAALYPRVARQVVPLVSTLRQPGGDTAAVRTDARPGPVLRQRPASARLADAAAAQPRRPPEQADRRQRPGRGSLPQRADGRPTAAEVKEVADYLKTPGKTHRGPARNRLGMLTSVEFRFNH